MMDNLYPCKNAEYLAEEDHTHDVHEKQLDNTVHQVGTTNKKTIVQRKIEAIKGYT